MVKQKTNFWKWAFFILLLANMMLFGLLFYFLSQPPPSSATSHPDAQSDSSDLTAELTLNEADMERLLQSGLGLLESDMELFIQVDEAIQLTGEVIFLGFPITYTVVAEPFPLENGDLQLKVEELHFGALSLPVEQSLSVIANQIAPGLPLSIYPEDQVLHVLLTKIEVEGIEAIKLLNIDKESREYSFGITISRENLLQ